MSGQAQFAPLLPRAEPGRGWSGGRFGFATLGAPGASLRDVIATARRHGAASVELRVAEDEPVHKGMPASRAKRVRDDFEAAGLTVLALSTYVRLCAPPPAPGTADPQLSDLRAHIELARQTGALAVRVFMGDESGDGERRAMGRLREVAAHAGEAGVRVLAETHDSHSPAARMSRFFSRLDAEVPGHGCGVVWDTAHTFSHGERPVESLALLLPWLGYLQIKDVRSPDDPTPVPLGSGAYPVDALASALRTAGFDGWISLEWERKWHPGLPPLDDALSAVREWAAPLFAVPSHTLSDTTEAPPA